MLHDCVFDGISDQLMSRFLAVAVVSTEPKASTSPAGTCKIS